MKFNRVWLGIMRRRFMRWLQSLFTSPPVRHAPSVPEYKGWTVTQQRLEEESYLANPHAIWLKPDRFETRLWMEGAWEMRAQVKEIYFPTSYAQWTAYKARIAPLENQLSNIQGLQNAAANQINGLYIKPSSMLRQHHQTRKLSSFGSILDPFL